MICNSRQIANILSNNLQNQQQNLNQSNQNQAQRVACCGYLPAG